MTSSLPAYVPPSLTTMDASFVWKNDLAHIGKLEGYADPMKAFFGITSCGGFCLGAGLVEWAAARFAHLTDVSLLRQLGDAMCVIMVNPDSIDGDALTLPPKSKAKVAWAYQTLCYQARFLVAPARWKDNAAPNYRELYQLASLVRHLVGKPHHKAFDAWLKAATQQVRAVAPAPKGKRALPARATAKQLRDYVAPAWGMPVPRAVLAGPVAPAAMDELFLAEMAAIDWSKNPLIKRTPSFGRPYGKR